MGANDITLVVTHSGDVVAGVQEVLSDWASAGLVRPFLWWCGCSEAGHLVRRNDQDEAELMLEVVGRERYATVRLVSLVVVPSTDEVDELEVGALAAELDDLLTARLGAVQVMARVNLVVPVTGSAGLPATLLNSYWDVNLVVADEDRQTPMQASPEVHHPGRLVPHTAAALATSAGLWQGMDAGPFDGVHEGGQQDIRVRVMRSYLRGLHCHGLVDDVSRQILDLQENQLWLADAVAAVAVADPSSILAKAFDQFTAGPGARLFRTAAVPPKGAPPRILSPREAFLEMWRFIIDIGRHAPGEALGYFYDKSLMEFEKFTQDVVFGDDSTAVVKIGSRTLAAERDNDERLSAGAAEFADALLASLDVHPPVPALGAQWRALRELSLGLLDAGTLPDGVDEVRERTRRLVVVDVERIVPDPYEEPFEFDWRQPSVPPADGAPAVDAVPAEPARMAVAPCDPAAAAEAGHRLQQDPADRERFDEWLGRRRRSLLWRIGERISADAAAAESALVDAIAQLARPRDDAGVDRRETSRMYRRLVLIGVLAALVVLAGPATWYFELVSGRAATAISVAGVVGGLLGWWLAFYPYAWRQFRLANARLVRVEEDKRARHIAEHEAAELLRLSAAYREFIDWAAIIGSVLHRPGGELPARHHVDLAKLSLPDAVQLGIAETDLPQRRRLAAIVGRRHFRRGWASGLLIELTVASMAALKFEKGAAEDDPDPEPDVDWQARERLLVDLMAGSAEVFGRRIHDDVDQHARQMPLRELFSGLEMPSEQEPEEFLAAIVSQPQPAVRESFSWRMWRPGRGPTDDETSVWTPRSIAVPTSPSVRSITAGGGPISLIWTARMDVSGPGRWSDLTIFDDTTPGSEPADLPNLDGVG